MSSNVRLGLISIPRISIAIAFYFVCVGNALLGQDLHSAASNREYLDAMLGKKDSVAVREICDRWIEVGTESHNSGLTAIGFARQAYADAFFGAHPFEVDLHDSHDADHVVRQPLPRHPRRDLVSAQKHARPRFDQRSRPPPNRKITRLEQAAANLETEEDDCASSIRSSSVRCVALGHAEHGLNRDYPYR